MDVSPKILMFSPAFAPFANPEAIVNNKLVLAFLDAGWDVDVITRSLDEESAYNYGSMWTAPWDGLREHTHLVSYRQSGIFNNFADTAVSACKTGYPMAGCRWARHAFELARGLHAEKRFDVILSRAFPDYGHLPALLMAKHARLPWIANWNDACHLKNPPPVGEGGNARLGVLEEKFLADVARTADWHTFPSDRMRSHICSYLRNGSEVKSTTIPHIAFQPVRARPRQLERPFTLCYAGNLYGGRNPDVFLQGFREFIDEQGISGGCKLVFIGLESIGLAQLLRDFRLEENAQVTGPLSYLETLQRFSVSDVLVVIETAYTDGICLPSKFVDYVQTGRPILAVSPVNGTLKDLLAVHGGGIAADCTSVAEVKASLVELHSCWLAGDLDEKYCSARLYELFAPDRVLTAYRDIFDGVCGNPSAKNLKTTHFQRPSHQNSAFARNCGP